MQSFLIFNLANLSNETVVRLRPSSMCLANKKREFKPSMNWVFWCTSSKQRRQVCDEHPLNSSQTCPVISEKKCSSQNCWRDPTSVHDFLWWKRLGFITTWKFVATLPPNAKVSQRCKSLKYKPLGVHAAPNVFWYFIANNSYGDMVSMFLDEHRSHSSQSLWNLEIFQPDARSPAHNVQMMKKKLNFLMHVI